MRGNTEKDTHQAELCSGRSRIQHRAFRHQEGRAHSFPGLGQQGILDADGLQQVKIVDW